MPRQARRFAPLAALLFMAGLAACSEDLEITGTCPTLCPGQEVVVEEVELQPVTFDTTVAGFPLRGTEALLLAMRSGDTLDTRAIYRFDDLPTYTGTGADSTPITVVRDPSVEVVYRIPESVLPGPVTVEAYDVTLAGDDSGSSALLPLFTPARRLGVVEVPPPAGTDTATVDTLSIPIPSDLLLERLQDEERLRIGLRVVTSGARLALSPTAAVISFRPSAEADADTIRVPIQSDLPLDDVLRRRDLASFTLVAAGTPPAGDQILTIGGLPARRALIEFDLPDTLLDSVTVIQATLVLQQRAVGGYRAADTLFLQPLALTASDVVESLDRRLQLAGNITSPATRRPVFPTTPLPVVPGNSGAYEIPMVDLVRTLRIGGEQVLAPALVLTYTLEGSLPLRAEFYSSEAPAALRPVLRLSYVRRIDFTLP